MRMSILYITVRQPVGRLVVLTATASAEIPEQLMTNGTEEEQLPPAASAGVALGPMARMLVPFAWV